MKMFIKTVEASKIISKCLHYSVIVTLLVAICTGFIGAIAAQKLLLAFDGNCILSVKVFYATVDNGTAIIAQPIAPSTTAIPTENVRTTTEIYTTTTVLPTLETSKNSTRENYAHIYRVLGKKKDPDVPMPKPRVLQVAGIPVDTESDVRHLSTTKIDVHRTHWGHYTRCEYFVFYPLFTGIVGILWGTMIIMFRGKGPDEFDWGIPKPWRIVLPSIVIFTLMTAFTLAYIIYMETLKKEFCNTLRVNLTTDMKCGDLLQSYQLHIPEGFSTRINYDLSTLMPRINISSWVLALLIMLARFFFAIDFQLVKVTVSTYKEDAGSSSGSSASKDELEENVIRLHDDTKSSADFDKKSSRFSSKDDLEDFESAISDTEMTTFTNSAPSSLEPLLHYKSTPTKVLNTGGM